MNTNDKTLADVQPGGRVRLGDQAERARAILANAYEQDGNDAAARSVREDDLMYESKIAVKAIIAALSAQPSPGGQGAPEIEQIRTLVSSILSTVSLGHQKGPYAYAGEDFGRYLAEATRDCRAILRALSDLAARQPVGEPAMYQVRPRSFPAGEGWREVSKRQFDDRGDFPGYPEAEWERRALYAAPPAQAVDLGQFRRPIEEWRSDMEQWVEGHGDYDGVFAKDIAEANRLLALIDSQAVGNG